MLRYSASFRDVLTIWRFREYWNAKTQNMFTLIKLFFECEFCQQQSGKFLQHVNTASDSEEELY